MNSTDIRYELVDRNDKVLFVSYSEKIAEDFARKYAVETEEYTNLRAVDNVKNDWIWSDNNHNFIRGERIAH